MKKPFAILWIALGGIVIFSLFYLPSLSKYHDLKQQQDELDEQLEKIGKEVQSAREERDLLKNDPEYLEKVIRDEMGLVKPGEIIYKFVKDEPDELAEEVVSAPAILTPIPVPTPSPALVVQAKPVVPSSAKKIAAVPVPKKSLPPAGEEPVYPRRETR